MRKASDPELSSWTLLIGSCLLACAHNIISRIWLSHPSASPGVRGSVSSSSCTWHSKHARDRKQKDSEKNLAWNNFCETIWKMDISLALLVGQFCFLPCISCEDLAAARTMEEETNLVFGPFLSCQIELMIYPLWQQFSCSHIGCPVMQCTCQYVVFVVIKWYIL